MNDKLGVKAPFYADFLLTSYCNLKCSFCSAGADCATESQQLSLKEVENTLQELDDLEVLRVALEGGEPFLRKDIIEIMQCADTRDFEYYVNTNATLIDVDLAKKIGKTQVSKLCVSIDGPNEAIHDQCRGVKGSFNKSVEAIRLLHEQGVKVDGIITISKMNKDYVVQTLQFLKSINIESVAVMFLATVGSANKNQDDIYMSFEDLTDLLLKLTNLKLANRLPTRLKLVPTGESFCPWELYLPLKAVGMEQHLSLWLDENLTTTLPDNSFGCTAGRDNLAIDSFGNVFGCSLMVSMEKISAGNIRSSSLNDIWFNSKVFGTLRDSSLCDIKGACSSCELLEKCRGGCRACAFGINGDILASDTRCPKAIEGEKK